MSKTKSKFKKVLVAIIVLTITGIVYVIAPISDDSGINSDENSVTERQPNSALKEGWTEYASETNGFSFVYPEDWILQTAGDHAEETIRIFSQQPVQEENIYSCLTVAPNPGITVEDETLLESLDNGNSIYSAPLFGDAGGETVILWLAGPDKAAAISSGGHQFLVTAEYNCVQDDYSVIRSDSSFIFEKSDEYSDLLDALRSFQS